MNDDDWKSRFTTATRSAPAGAYGATMGVPTSDFARSNFQSQYGRTPTSTPTATPAPVTATSRIIPAPSNTNWNSTFLNNQPSSPSGTDWKKVFGASPSFVSSPSSSPVSGIRSPQSSFSLSLSPNDNQSQLRLPTSDFQDRTANLDLTTRDHELYGAGPDMGFNY